MAGVVRSFSGQRVLDGVDFDLRAGEVHVLAGENGAGKSTLMKILGGVLAPDSGVIEIEGRRVRFGSAQDAARAGVAVIHQELSLAPSMSVEDNIVLGREPARFGGRIGSLLGPFAPVDRAARRRAAAAALDRVGLAVDPRRPVGSLALAQRQLVEIAKAMVGRARVIVMDEPTSALPATDAERLFSLIAGLKSGPTPAGIVFISHRMEEIYRLSDRITVLRDGRKVLTADAANLSRVELVRAMVGRALDDSSSASMPGAQGTPVGEPLLRVSDLTVRSMGAPVLEGVSLDVGRAEIVGVAGLQGSGVSALLHTLFGDPPGGARASDGSITLEERAYEPSSPAYAMARGLALLTDDRKTTGLCQSLSLRENLVLPAHAAGSPWVPAGAARERADSERVVRDFAVRCRSIDQPVRTLSGGNQQKTALGKWALTRPILYLLDDPTRGVDVGAKHEIHGLIRAWAGAGAGVLLASSELPELLSLSDRVVVLHRGRVAARFDRADATPERVIAAALGVAASPPAPTEPAESSA